MNKVIDEYEFNQHGFKVGDIVLRDEGTVCENKVEIVEISPRGLMAQVKSYGLPSAKPYTSMMSRLTPLKD